MYKVSTAAHILGSKSTARFFSAFFTCFLGFALGFTLGFALAFAFAFALVFTLVFALVFVVAGALAPFWGAAALVTPAPTFAGRLNTGVIEMGRVKANREARVGRRTRLATEDATRYNIVKLK